MPLNSVKVSHVGFTFGPGRGRRVSSKCNRGLVLKERTETPIKKYKKRALSREGLVTRAFTHNPLLSGNIF